MIKVIIGKKGSGKTKYMIDEVNTAVKEEPGCLVFLSKGNRLMYDLAHNVRYVNTQEFDIENYDEFYGFICGIISNNFDTSHIFIDSAWKIVDSAEEGFENFLKQLENIGEKFNIRFSISISADKEDAPEYLVPYLVEL